MLVIDPTPALDAALIRKIRLLIPDAKVGEQIFPDSDIADFYDLAHGAGNARMFRAAALAKLAIADDTARVESFRKTQALEVDGSKAAKVIQDSAKALEARANAIEAKEAELLAAEEGDGELFLISPGAGAWRCR